jgi:hypothetical protein
MIFDDFDFNILKNPEYKEDSVREDILAPLLSRLGFSSHKDPRIVRGKRLKHPYVMIGSKKYPINIVPDYLIYAGDKVRLVIEAKSPQENIDSGDHVSQAYSYSIHPEVRTRFYCLCNGYKFNIFNVSKVQPIKSFNLHNLNDNDIMEMIQKMRILDLSDDAVMNYNIDLGIFMKMNGFLEDGRLSFLSVPMFSIAKLDSENYTFSSATGDLTDRSLLMSVDFTQSQFETLCSFLQFDQVKCIKDALSRQPFMYLNEVDPPTISIITKLSERIVTSRSGEEFLPLKLIKFLRG